MQEMKKSAEEDLDQGSTERDRDLAAESVGAVEEVVVAAEEVVVVLLLQQSAGVLPLNVEEVAQGKFTQHFYLVVT